MYRGRDVVGDVWRSVVGGSGVVGGWGDRRNGGWGEIGGVEGWGGGLGDKGRR